MSSRIRYIPLKNVHITDTFWVKIRQLINEVVLPYQWEVLNDCAPNVPPSFCMRNFKVAAGAEEGLHQGVVFEDSGLYKWLEAVAYSLTAAPNAALEAAAEEAIAWIGKAQAQDGYLNTYYTTREPDQRFCNLTDGHELYCAGHLFEAAAAYYEATGRRELLDIACRFADCLVRHFLDGNPEGHGYPGHPEVELALVKLYLVTRKDDYLRLCSYFLNVRGLGEDWRDVEQKRGGFVKIWGDLLFSEFPRSYFQAHVPVRAQREASGHAVRAVFLYCAMTDIARLNRDETLAEACRHLYHNIITRRMYVTGGIGSATHGECLTADFDLPDDTAYAETCASVGLMMLSSRMWLMDKQPSCFDIWERALYNTVLASMSRDGRHFFYTNPLSADPRLIRKNPSLNHVEPTRPPWFGVACCPPNMARCLLSLGGAVYAQEEGVLYVLTHISSEAVSEAIQVVLTQTGDRYILTLDAPPLTLKMRVPQGSDLRADFGWIQSGYLIAEHPGGKAAYAYRLIANIRVLHAHPHAAHYAGKVCVVRGQTVYCLEEADNGSALCALALPRNAVFREAERDWLPDGIPALETEGLRYEPRDADTLYGEPSPSQTSVPLVFVPYHQWNNRGEGEMRVWVNEAPC